MNKAEEFLKHILKSTMVYYISLAKRNHIKPRYEI